MKKVLLTAALIAAIGTSATAQGIPPPILIAPTPTNDDFVVIQPSVSDRAPSPGGLGFVVPLDGIDCGVVRVCPADDGSGN